MNSSNIPSVVSYKDVFSKLSLSASSYENITMTNSHYLTLKELLKNPIIDGKEVGSDAYIYKSKRFFIRTKALQPENFLIFFNQETIVPINKKYFKNQHLSKGMILISKDSNIGESAYLNEDMQEYMISAGIKGLDFGDDRFYVLGFLKSEFFKGQLEAMTSKGAIIKHSKTKFLECLIPFPNQENRDEIRRYISALVKAIIRKEEAIVKKDRTLISLIEDEISANQSGKVFNYHLPRFDNVKNGERIDAGFYSRYLQYELFKVKNYLNGFKPLTEWNFDIKPGTSLEMKILGTRQDSEVYKPGYYTLVTPSQISEYGTFKEYRYLGTRKDIFQLKKGDIIFGESGNGRSAVVAYETGKIVTNAHGNILRPPDEDITKSAFLRGILHYYKFKGIYNLITVGGSGGHLSPVYFDRIPIPDFRDEAKRKIVELYYNPTDYQVGSLQVENFEENDVDLTNRSGILELDKQVKLTKKRLKDVVNQVISNKRVEIDFTFLSNDLT